MQNIRTIGGAGGVFHILVPGVFLLLNIVGCVYIFPFTPSDTRAEIQKVLGSPAIGVMITIAFGYLLGVILRIFRCEYPDQWSAKILRLYDSNARPPETDKNRYAYENFPYTQWMEQANRSLPDDVKEFYEKTWKGATKQFMNFAKLVVISEDERAGNEIYAAESLCRYIAGMFYALVTSTVLNFTVLFIQVVTLQVPNIILLILFVGYSIAVAGILINFRFMRIKEVQTVFYSAYKNRHLFS